MDNHSITFHSNVVFQFPTLAALAVSVVPMLTSKSRLLTWRNVFHKHAATWTICYKLNVWTMQDPEHLSPEYHPVHLLAEILNPLSKNTGTFLSQIQHSNAVLHHPALRSWNYPTSEKLLVRAHPPPLTPRHCLQTILCRSYTCGNCPECNLTYETSTFEHPFTGTSFDIKGVITCNTNIIT